MKSKGRYLLLVALAAASMVAGRSEAQTSTWEGSIGAGPSLPMGNLSDEASTGFHAMGTLGFNPEGLPFGLRLEAYYQKLNAVEREASVYSVLGGEWYSALGGALNAKYALPLGTLSPYVLAGAGWNYNWHHDRTYWPEKQQTVSFNGGIGVDFSVAGINTFLEARHLNIFGGKALETRPPTMYREVPFKSIPVTLGIRF